MTQIGLLKAMPLCKKYPKMDAADRDALRRQRLDALVADARANSPYYAKLYPGNRMELRLIPADGVSREEAYGRAAERLHGFFASQGVYEYRCTLSADEPKANPKSGKFKHIIQESCEVRT